MFIEFLGAHGGKGEGQNNTCVLIQENTLIDAGNILNSLGNKRALCIDRIFLTHAHLDHISDIPFLIDTVFSQREKPIEIYGLENTIRDLKENIFNWKVWPDFSSIPLLGQKNSAVVFHTIKENQAIELEEITLTPILANHTVDCTGYIITQRLSGESIYMTGDTYKHKKIWDTINNNPDIKTLVIDVAFPSFCYQLGIDSKHLTPKALEEDIKEHLIRDDIQIAIYHTKPSHYNQTKDDLDNMDIKQKVNILHDNSKIYFNGIIRHQDERIKETDTITELSNRLEVLNQIGSSLSRREDIDELIEDIVLKTNACIGVDGLSLYFMSECRKYLEFRVIQTKSLNIDMRHTHKNVKWQKIPLLDINGKPNQAMAVSVCANEKRMISIDDIYHCDDYVFTGAKKIDESNNYRTKSMLISPMLDNDDKVIGILQLINRVDEHEQIIKFNQEDKFLISSLSSQVAVVLSNKKLVHDLETLFNSFIRIIGNAIDETSEHTGGHVRKVSGLSHILAKYINDDKTGFYKNVNFTKDEFQEIEIASWIHDIGKITVPEHKLDKATKLETVFDLSQHIKAKFEIHKRDIKIKMLEYQLSKASIEEKDIDNCIKVEEDYEKEIKIIEENIKIVEFNNVGKEFMPMPEIKKIIEMALEPIQINGVKEMLINPNEILNLCIQAGTLTFEEKEVIKKHAFVGYDLLNKLEFPEKLKDAVQIACNHHECLNGKGYPRGITADLLTVKDRIMILSDIFEALTSSDRPYKDAKTLSETFRILGFMVKDGNIDGDMIRFFVESGACDEFSDTFLLPSQVDEFKLSF